MRMLFLSLLLTLSGCGNEYEKRGELFQCFVDGEQIYKSNEAPVFRGDDWWVTDDGKFQADDCLCMGCVGF